MDQRCIAAISLSNADFVSVDAKMQEAASWVEHAANNGAHLAILPEFINRYCGDGAGNPRARPVEELAFDNWQNSCAPILDAAARGKIDVVVPVIRRESSSSGDALTNCFFLVSHEGTVLGEYQKRFPTPEELAKNVRPGHTPLIPWRGIQVGGAICFDTLFPQVFADQAAEGAQFFIVPSLWPGGTPLATYALEHATPIALSYPAWSRILDADGSELASAGYRSETLRFGFGSPIAMATVNFDQVTLFGNHNQQKIVDLQRAYGSRIRVRFTQQDVLFLVESLCPDLPISQVVQEFGLVSRRDYLQACLQEVADFRATAQ